MKHNIAKAARADIPLLQKSGEHYLDNAATALMPRAVVNATAKYDKSARANVGRGLHRFAEIADEHYENARNAVAKILGARDDEIIFTSGSTAALNLLANSLSQNLGKGDAVLLSAAEHHSNIVPWQIAARRRGFTLRFAGVSANGGVDVNDARRLSKDGRARVFAITHASNVSGAINDIGAVAKIAKHCGALFVVDGAQYIPHSFVNLPSSGADFYVFSGHKCHAPTGVGVLWGRHDALMALPAAVGGGGAVASVCESGFAAAELPRRLEAGTPPITQAIGLSAALQWLRQLPRAARDNENELAKLARRELQKIKGVRVLFSGAGKRAPIVSFVVGGVHAHDCCEVLAARNVAVRGGHHCAEPLMRRLGIDACVRASFAPYNNAADVRALVGGVRDAVKMLG